jgi:predicted lactoylglutathione lyase
MPQSIFVNLPVADVARSTAFYEALGFTLNPQFSAEHASSMMLSDTITIMILAHDFFQTFTPKQIADAHQTSEVLIALSRDGREAVDAMINAAVAHGGRGDVRAPQDMGFMYGRSFEDPDGHIFEPMYMDMAAAMQAMAPAAEG